MKIILIIALLTTLLGAQSWAKEEKKKKDSGLSMKALGTIDASSAPASKTEIKDEMADHAALYAEPSKVKMSFSCKTSAGLEIKQGEAGYDECLRNVKNEQFNRANKKGNANPNLPASGDNATIKVEFGK